MCQHARCLWPPPPRPAPPARGCSPHCHDELRHRSYCDVLNNPGMRHLLRTREHVCARVRTCGTLCAPAGASAHAWLQLAWLRHAHRCGNAVAALKQPGRRRRRQQRPPRPATRLGYARYASNMRYKQMRELRRSQCKRAQSPGIMRHLVSTCGHVCARVAPCAHLLATVRTRGCSWLGCHTRSDAAAQSQRALHQRGRGLQRYRPACVTPRETTRQHALTVRSAL
jgi:hypothetical protein